jgi:hypothetical protein
VRGHQVSQLDTSTSMKPYYHTKTHWQGSKRTILIADA